MFGFKDGELPYWGRKGWRPWSLTPWGSEQNVFPACKDKGNTHAQEGNRGQTPIRLLGSEDKAVALGTEGLSCPSEHLVEKPPRGLSSGTTLSGHPHRELDLGRDKDSGWLAHCCSESIPALPVRQWSQLHSGALASCGRRYPAAWLQASFGVTKLVRDGVTAQPTRTLGSQNNASEQEGSK